MTFKVVSQDAYQSGTDPVVLLDADDDTAYVDPDVSATGEYDGIDTTTGSNQKIYNYGVVAGLKSTGIYAQTANLFIFNDQRGFIEGRYSGILFDGLFSAQPIQNADIENHGAISSNRDGIDLSFCDSSHIENTGSISAAVLGMDINDSANVAISNSGEIWAGKYGVDFETGNFSENLTNTATIHGSVAAIYDSGISGGALGLLNSGTLDGAVLLGGESDTVRSSGKITGAIDLGDGNDVFNGRGGVVSDPILGGAGADRIYAGNDGETLDGGSGRDRLYGGSGYDTFVISSDHTADFDVLVGFDPTKDLIHVNPSVFTHLHVGVDPTFHIGSKAASPTDFLFYDSGTGILHYDVDGSRSAHVSFSVANLGTGLHLTAKNFLVA